MLRLPHERTKCQGEKYTHRSTYNYHPQLTPLVSLLQLRPCGHSVTCRVCTKKLIDRGEPCPFCRKPIEGYDVGKWQTTTGGYGLWPTSLKNLSQLACGDGFNAYFKDLFDGNKAPYLKWKSYFDQLGIKVVKGRESLEQQVLKITREAGIEDLGKLKALTKLCSQECFDDPSLRVVAYRRALEVSESPRSEPRQRAIHSNSSLRSSGHGDYDRRTGSSGYLFSVGRRV